MSEPEESLVLARAKLNFARKGHGERCWDAEPFDDPDGIRGNGCPILALSQAERDEFLEQARHELRRAPAP
ncbi:hypothetical protein [Methylobacterium sp. J-090]|uniref:hypothetical protein n=1 Tax=Methylobacterium sp. J-090 TaxID=2836666 RepID=UPI001FB86DF1|nr:hypothetical protein [Methylobacterium sp. J-090]MCJ2082862.1 hypothetical protein [Methylobacterium sp. J-090]